MADSIDGRKSERVPSDLYLEFRVPGSRNRGNGQVQDLSDEGVSFTTRENLKPGTTIYMRIPFVNSRTPPLMSPAEVIRCCAFD